MHQLVPLIGRMTEVNTDYCGYDIRPSEAKLYWGEDLYWLQNLSDVLLPSTLCHRNSMKYDMDIHSKRNPLAISFQRSVYLWRWRACAHALWLTNTSIAFLVRCFLWCMLPTCYIMNDVCLQGDVHIWLMHVRGHTLPTSMHTSSFFARPQAVCRFCMQLLSFSGAHKSPCRDRLW